MIGRNSAVSFFGKFFWQACDIGVMEISLGGHTSPTVQRKTPQS